MDLLLLVLILLAAIAAAIGAWRPRPQADVADTEAARRTLEELARLRESVESHIRALGESQSKAQLDLFQRLTTVLAEDQKRTAELLNSRLAELNKSLAADQAASRQALGEALARLEKAQLTSVERLGTFEARLLEQARKQTEDALKSQNALLEKVSTSFTALQDRVGENLRTLREENEKKLEKIRETVGEKLQSTLEARLGESFKLVSERLEQVHKGLGEMQQLASGVGDLKRVLTNVRTRGTFGETQLAQLLEQVLIPSQYRVNVVTRPNSNERVEFAVVLPGRGAEDTEVLLPIDAKFPQEDYLRLQDAYEAADADGIKAARKALSVRLEGEAKRIREKYIEAPHTTDFALLFVPTEGLYAEALRLDGIFEQMQSRHQVILVGPTTLFAVLNSLQMGFRTLAIEKRSSEVWKVLGAVRTEFSKFADSLDAVSKKLHEASNKIDDSARRSRAVERRLRGVEELPLDEARALLPELDDEQPIDE